MRMGGLAAVLILCGAVAAHADEPANKTEAPAAVQPAAPTSAPATVPQAVAPAAEVAKPAAESKADKQPSAPEGARYGFERVDGGYLRFDYHTGRVAYCMPRAEAWGCQAVPEERAALDKEVERLSAENAELRSRVTDLEAKLKGLDDVPRPPQPIPPETKPAAPNPTTGGDETLSLPGREHIAHAATVMQDAWQRFVELVTTLKNDVLRRSGA